MIDHDFWCIRFVNEYEDDSYCEFFEGSFQDAEKYATESCPPGYIIYGVFDYPHPGHPEDFWGEGLSMDLLPDE